MKMQEEYEINLASLMGLWLIHWKRIVCAGAAAALVALSVTLATFQAPSEKSKTYQSIQRMLLDRASAEEMLASAESTLETNLLYEMDSAKIITKRLTVLVELEDKSQITDQLDPTDLVLYAYHNMARSTLQGSVLVPEVLTKVQQEQLLSVSYDGTQNLLVVSMTSDEEALVDSVLAIAAQWYQDQQDAVTAQTQSHKLSILPVSETIYNQAERDAIVSPSEIKKKIRTLEDAIQAYNAELDELFQKPEDWALTKTVEELEELYQAKVRSEAQPSKRRPLILGGLTGAFLAALWVSFSVLSGGRLLGEDGIGRSSGWQYIGRLKPLKRQKDPIVRWGFRRLYREPEAEAASLTRETREMTKIFLTDRGFPGEVTIGLIGSVSDAQLQSVAGCLAEQGRSILTVQLKDRAAANQLCRTAQALIFVGSAENTACRDVTELAEMLAPLEKTPVGYILI